ncbi:ABC transporter permease [Occallatibacter riparius]|uniref:ABC transporter permease n=1 Tax=Occallatibacter riparius TaxID=1002689 RepID=A0A9J7BTN5_9BACT|nr:ABC transporter permease [Occallatibacter riparius]UWZ86236.1 ABC transporter permease [Occallatibacter riparius]
MATLLADIRQSVRMFWKSPAFTIAVLAALALGIGADTAIFSVVNAVLLKPLTYPEPDRIVQFRTTSRDGGEFQGASVTKFHMWQAQTGVVQDAAAYDFGSKGMNLTGNVPEQVKGVHVSEAYFRLFGARMTLGRTFTPQEDLPHGGNLVVISYGFWKRKFGGDPNVIGRTLPLSGEPYTIIGVVDRDFESDPAADLWLPFQFPPNSTDQAHYFQAAARLKPGVSLGQAQAQMKLGYSQFKRLYPEADPNDSFTVKPLKDAVVGDMRKSLLVLIGAVSFVLLIACANVANLLMVRAAGRKREFAIRAAMGAKRIRMIQQLLTESILLALVGGVLGLGLGFIGVRWLLSVRPGAIPRIGEDGAGVSIDWRVALFTVGVSILTGILFGLIPAFGASRPDLAATMNEGGSRSGFGLRQSKARSMLIVSEVGLALVLLVGAALLIRTFIALRMVKPGFDAHNVITMEMSLTGQRYSTTGGVAQLIRDSRDRIKAIPGVEEVGVSDTLPLDGGFGLPFIIVGRPLKGPATGGSEWKCASPGYFGAFHIPILRGRDFTVNDVNGAPPVVLISEAFAKENWKNGEDPIGQQLIIGKGVGPEFEEPARTIIGIVGDVHDRALDDPAGPVMIVPQAQMGDGITLLNSRIAPFIWIIRTQTDPYQVVPAVTEQLRIASGGFPVAHIRTMDEVVVRSTARQDFNMLLLSIFGGSALLLAAIGIYGLMAYSVTQRVREIGIRMALGADRGNIRSMVVWQGMRLAIAGVVLGVGAAFALTRLIASSLYGVKSWDPAVFITVPIVLSAVALAATWMPAVRASRLDPMKALRID